MAMFLQWSENERTVNQALTYIYQSLKFGEDQSSTFIEYLPRSWDNKILKNKQKKTKAEHTACQ